MAAINLISWTLFYQTAGEKVHQIADCSIAPRTSVSCNHFSALDTERSCAFYSKNVLPPSDSSFSDGVFSCNRDLIVVPASRFGISDEELELGMRAMAVPVIGDGNEIIAVISVNAAIKKRRVIPPLFTARLAASHLATRQRAGIAIHARSGLRPEDP